MGVVKMPTRGKDPRGSGPRLGLVLLLVHAELACLLRDEKSCGAYSVGLSEANPTEEAPANAGAFI